jgi:AcrR family transcriptional regulator
MSARPKPYHHGDLREALVAAGTKLLKEQGPAALTLRACAREAGVSHAAPQHHFENAAGLLSEIAARGFEAFVAHLDRQSASAITPEQRLEAMCSAYVHFALENAAVYALMFRQQVLELGSPHLDEAKMAAWDQLAGTVASVLATRNMDEVMMASAFVWSQVHGLATLLIDRRFPPGIDSEVLICNAARSVIAALKRA